MKLQSELEREWLWRRYESLVAESLAEGQKRALAEEMLRCVRYFRSKNLKQNRSLP